MAEPGNAVGILNEPDEHLLTALERERDPHEKSKALLECIASLLTDAEKLQRNYGVQSYEVGEEEIPNLSVVKAETRKRRALSKLKWAIFDKQKFQALINDLQDLIDQLFMITFNHVVPVDAQRLDRSMRTDIELVDNIAQLSLIQEACEDSYRAWSEHAASVIEESEIGSINRRNIEEISRDLAWGDVDPRASGNLTSQRDNGSTSAFRLVSKESRSYEKVFFILTEQCVLTRESKLCDPAAVLGLAESEEYIIYQPRDFKRTWAQTCSPADALKPIISTTIKSKLHTDYDSEEKRLYGLLVKGSDYLDEIQRDLIETCLPVLTVHIHCAPCACLISTAIRMCKEMKSQLVKVMVRPDSRLQSSCCPEGSGLKRLQDISEKISREEGFQPYFSAETNNWIFSATKEVDREDFIYIDHRWLEKLVFDHQEASEATVNLDLQTKFRLDTSQYRPDFTLVLGDANLLAPEMLKPPFPHMPRVPKQSEVFQMTRNPNAPQERPWRWEFTGRFSPRWSTSTEGIRATRSATMHPNIVFSFSTNSSHVHQQKSSPDPSLAIQQQDNRHKRQRTTFLPPDSGSADEMSTSESDHVRPSATEMVD